MSSFPGRCASRLSSSPASRQILTYSFSGPVNVFPWAILPDTAVLGHRRNTFLIKLVLWDHFLFKSAYRYFIQLSQKLKLTFPCFFLSPSSKIDINHIHASPKDNMHSIPTVRYGIRFIAFNFILNLKTALLLICIS